jgi:accessory colonization factor AcfC
MELYQNKYAQKIHEILSPYIGEVMSKGALRAQCKQIGITEEMIDGKHIPDLAEKLRKGLIIFVGTEGAGYIASRIINAN